MEPELHGVNVVPPPLLPPPVAPPRASHFLPATLWRWNERLALVVGGLTILLAGVLAGRVLGPATEESNAEPSTVANLVSNAGPLETVESAAEVNPPENVTAAEVASPAASPERASEESITVVAGAPVTTPVKSTPAPESESSIPAADEPPAEPVHLPVFMALTSSLPAVESKVASIVPPPSTLVCGPAKSSQDRKLSTALIWSESVDEASQRAEEETKLVFLIHVSGNFESPGFT